MNYNKHLCDYDKYFIDQAGGSLDIAYYRGNPYQRGYGRFSSFARRFGIPAMKYLFKHGLEFGKNLYSDIREGKDVKESIKSNLKKRLSSTLQDIDSKIAQSGTGMRKRPRLMSYKKRQTRKKRVRPKRTKRKSGKTKRKRSKKSYKRSFGRRFNTDIFNDES